MLETRKLFAAWLLSVGLVAPALAQTVMDLSAVSSGAAADVRSVLTVPAGQRLRLEGMPLGDTRAEVVSADLVRAPGSSVAPLLVVHSDDGVSTSRPEQPAHFTGQLVGDPRSSVFVSIDSDGTLRSIVRRGEEVFVSDMPVPAAPGTREAANTSPLPAQPLRSRRVDMVADAPAQPFACGVDDEFIEAHYEPPSEELLANLRANHLRAGMFGVASQGTQALGERRRADIIIETDYELLQRLGSSSAVYAYVTDLLGYVSSQYESEIGARLNVTQINVYTSSSIDPWTDTTNRYILLDELRAYWNASPRSSQPRHHVHFLSGRSTGGGVAYLGTLGGGRKGYAYALSGNILGNFVASNPQVIWDSKVVAHEIGHAFGSTHTHSFDNPNVGYGEGAIDCCYADSGGAECVARNGGEGKLGVLPGLNSISGGSPRSRAGTLMSYCQHLDGGMSNISFNFGTNHLQGVNAWRVASVMQSNAATYLPLDATVQNYTLSVSRQGAGSGTVTSSPAGINCGSTCSASFAASTPVTLTAQAAAGSTFAGWSGACTGTGSCSVAMDAAKSVTASFNTAASTRVVTLSKTGSGTGSVTSTPSGLSCAAGCTGATANFSTTAAITLAAQPSSGSVFAGWSGACTGTGSCTIPAGSSSVSVTASFTSGVTTLRTVTLVKGGDGAGSVTSSPAGLSCAAGCNEASATFSSSAAITLMAQSVSGSRFVGWSGACAGTGSCVIAAGTSNVRVTASFNANDSGGGGPLADPVVFVNQQYLDFLGRSPDSAALNDWVRQLNAGFATRAQVIEALMNSEEFQNRFGSLVRLYTAYFRRIPDYGGLMYWFNAMNPSNGRGASLAQVSQEFAQSQEFFNTYGMLDNAGFVTRVYQNVLGRDPEPEGYKYWLGQLSAGMSRGEMMIGFSESLENKNARAHSLRVTMSHVGMLRRAPTQVEYDSWVSEISAGRVTVLDLINALLNSQEYAARF